MHYVYVMLLHILYTLGTCVCVNPQYFKKVSYFVFVYEESNHHIRIDYIKFINQQKFHTIKTEDRMESTELLTVLSNFYNSSYI